MKRLIQFILDRTEDIATKRQWIGLTFRIISLKQRLGLRIQR